MIYAIAYNNTDKSKLFIILLIIRFDDGYDLLKILLIKSEII